MSSLAEKLRLLSHHQIASLSEYEMPGTLGHSPSLGGFWKYNLVPSARCSTVASYPHRLSGCQPLDFSATCLSVKSLNCASDLCCVLSTQCSPLQIGSTDEGAPSHALSHARASTAPCSVSLSPRLYVPCCFGWSTSLVPAECLRTVPCPLVGLHSGQAAGRSFYRDLASPLHTICSLLLAHLCTPRLCHTPC